MKRIDQLSNWLVGEWSNQRQAFNNPAVFANVRVVITQEAPYQYRLTQRYKQESKPYRERLLKLEQVGRSKFLLHTRKPGAEEDVCNCHYEIEWDQDKKLFTGAINLDQNCRGTFNEEEYVLSADLTLSENQLQTRDEGVKPDTKEHLWGQPLFPFVFDRLS